MDHKQLAAVIATIKNFDERERIATSIGAICAVGKCFEWWSWYTACEVTFNVKEKSPQIEKDIEIMNIQHLADVISSIKNFDERERIATSIGAICADGKCFEWWSWHMACKTTFDDKETPVEQYSKMKRRLCNKGMVIWVNKDVVYAACNQRAVVQEVKGADIRVRLLGDNHEFTIRPCDIVGFEIDDNLIIKFSQPRYLTYCGGAS